MGGKTRVHELAKELGVTSKELLAKLREQGEFVKSASSTVERPAADRLRAHFGTNQPDRRRPNRTEQTPGPGRRGQRTVIITPQHQIVRPRQLTESEASDLCNDYRLAYADINCEVAIKRLLRKYQKRYHVSQSVLHSAINDDQRRNADLYSALRRFREQKKSSAPPRKAPQQRATTQRRREAARPQPPAPRPRTRHPGLPPATITIHPEAIADLVAKADTGHDRQQIATDLAPFDPTHTAGYGYLGWRYATTHRHPAPTTGDELATIARIVDTTKHRLQQIHDTTRGILEHSNLAPPALESGFSDLFDPDDIGRAASDERRRVMNKHAFLHRAVLLTVANPQCAERLWDMLDQLQPPPQHALFETTPALRTATQALTDDLADVEALLSSDDAALERFIHRSHAELTDLHNGRYDYLQHFRDAGSEPSRRVISGLAFTVLPPGVQLRTLVNERPTDRRYNYRHYDDNRLTVLEELREHFGAHRCIIQKGSVSSRGVDNRYYVLSIASTTGSAESAVAISPLAGEHATYVVRPECVDAHWANIFELTKQEARDRGARRIPFRGGAEQYTEMLDKVIEFLERPSGDFHKH